MEIKHREITPSVHPDAYVAPTAVLSGQVTAMLAREHRDDE
jgi:carbonic anhydrase/acetyltransferase-like protein (isoleucine patch superfamily)